MSPAPELDARDLALLRGEHGEALRFAMEVVVHAATLLGASRLIDVGFVHVDACHHYGRAHNDFARYLLERGARFGIPAWTNTVPVSLVQPEVRVGADLRVLDEARELTELYVALGAEPTWTCAPYQLPGGPAFGDHIVGSESNAVAYYNSVVGARTNKYGDFLDVCAGLVARAPFAGLHVGANRAGTLLVDIEGIDEALRASEVFCHVLGHLMGGAAGSEVPVIQGLPPSTTPDALKAISAAGAASGGIALFHAIGVTPEAASLDAAFAGGRPRRTLRVSPPMIARARDSLSTARAGPLRMVALGTPHFSLAEFARLVAALDDRPVHRDVTFYVTTGRQVAARAAESGWLERLERAGVTVLVDTCTYFSPAVRAARGRAMTNSAKWAYYAPGMLPVEVAFGSLADCVESAVAGEIRHDRTLWEGLGR